jgi:hypothetical protein
MVMALRKQMLMLSSVSAFFHRNWATEFFSEINVLDHRVEDKMDMTNRWDIQQDIFKYFEIRRFLVIFAIPL